MAGGAGLAPPCVTSEPGPGAGFHPRKSGVSRPLREWPGAEGGARAGWGLEPRASLGQGGRSGLRRRARPLLPRPGQPGPLQSWRLARACVRVCPRRVCPVHGGFHATRLVCPSAAEGNFSQLNSVAPGRHPAGGVPCRVPHLPSAPGLGSVGTEALELGV